MANAEFTQRYGVPAPGTPKGNYPVTIAELVQGGLHVVPNEEDMCMILPQYREEGMEVNVLSTQRKYRLIYNPDTKYTLFKHWKYIPDGIGIEELNIILQQNGLSDAIDRLLANLRNYLSKAEATQLYFDRTTIMRYYQTIEDMRNYVTQEEFQRVMLCLSKYVSRVLPFDIIIVPQGTPLTDISMPTHATVYYGDSNVESVPVIWDSPLPYDPNLIGYQIMEGKMILPDQIDVVTYPNAARCHQIIFVTGEYVLPTMSPTVKGGAKNGAGLVMTGTDADVVQVDLRTAVDRQEIDVINPETQEISKAIQTSIGKIKLGRNLELDGDVLNCIATGGSVVVDVDVEYETFNQDDVDDMFKDEY